MERNGGWRRLRIRGGKVERALEKAEGLKVRSRPEDWLFITAFKDSGSTQHKVILHEILDMSGLQQIVTPAFSLTFQGTFSLSLNCLIWKRALNRIQAYSI